MPYFKALGNAYSVGGQETIPQNGLMAQQVAQCALSYMLNLMVHCAHIKVCIFFIFAKVLEVM